MLGALFAELLDGRVGTVFGSIAGGHGGLNLGGKGGDGGDGSSSGRHGFDLLWSVLRGWCVLRFKLLVLNSYLLKEQSLLLIDISVIQ